MLRNCMETTTQTPIRPTMRHRLRIAAACFCLVLCIGFVALWVQIYSTYGQLFKTGRFSVCNQEGSLCLVWKTEAAKKTGPRLVDKAVKLKHKQKKRTTSNVVGFAPADRYCFPHWLIWSPVLLTGGLAVLLKPKPRLKFSLRELLLLTTITAVVLGAVAALGRAGS